MVISITNNDFNTNNYINRGRLSIGLYSLYLLKWLEHFSLSQFLVIRLEDYDDNPKEYMRKLFKFLELSEPNESDWNMITFNNHINENKIHRFIYPSSLLMSPSLPQIQ